LAKAMHEVAQELARQRRLPGYRPGKAPTQRVAAIVGEEALREAAIHQMERDLPVRAVVAEELSPSAPVAVETVSHDPLTIRVIVPLKPKVELGDYRALRVAAPAPEPTSDDAVDEQIGAWRRDLSVATPVEGPSEAGDTMTLDLVGRLDDRVVFDATDLDLPLTGEAAVAAGLPAVIADELIGLSPGVRRGVDVTYSELWSDAALQGRTVAFEAHVKSVTRSTPPAMDDALGERLGVAGLDDLRQRVRQQLEARAQIEATESLLERAIEALTAQARVTYPPALLDAEVDKLVADLRQRFERQGLTWERWLALQPNDEATISADLERQADENIRRAWALMAFAEAEGISIDPAEVEDEVERFSSVYSGVPRRQRPERDAIRRTLVPRMLSSRTLARLIAIVKGEAAGSPAIASEPDMVAIATTEPAH